MSAEITITLEDLLKQLPTGEGDDMHREQLLGMLPKISTVSHLDDRGNKYCFAQQTDGTFLFSISGEGLYGDHTISEEAIVDEIQKAIREGSATNWSVVLKN